jgi:hypothetical protein
MNSAYRSKNKSSTNAKRLINKSPANTTPGIATDEIGAVIFEFFPSNYKGTLFS